MEKIENIVLIGAGNVATHLGQALQQSGRKILQVFSRTISSAELLARRLDCEYTIDISQIKPGADLYLFSLADNALMDILEQFPFKNVFAAHTSGSLPLELLEKSGLHGGVFYPLQTFSKIVKPDFSQIPICIEAQNKKYELLLHEMASGISKDVRYINTVQRETLHIAAVFACNFTNHMYSIADEILGRNQIDFDILYPLMEETLRKARHQKPALVQTGPAVRNDHAIVEKHIAALSALPHYQKIYTFISQSIINNFKKQP